MRALRHTRRPGPSATAPLAATQKARCLASGRVLSVFRWRRGAAWEELPGFVRAALAQGAKPGGAYRTNRGLMCFPLDPEERRGGLVPEATDGDWVVRDDSYGLGGPGLKVVRSGSFEASYALLGPAAEPPVARLAA